MYDQEKNEYDIKEILLERCKKGVEAFMGHLILDDTTIYEIDEECMRRKEQQKKAGNTREADKRNQSADAETSQISRRTYQ